LLCAKFKNIYLVSDLDEQDKDDDDKQVVNNTDYPGDYVDCLEYKIHKIVRLQRRRRCGDVIRDVTRQR